MRNAPLHEKLAFIGLLFLGLAVLQNQCFQIGGDTFMLFASNLFAWISIALLAFYLITELRLHIRRKRRRMY